MTESITRRRFLRNGAALGVTLSSARAKPPAEVRIGFIGVGARGLSHVREFLKLDRATLKAVCDIVPERVERAQAAIVKAGRPAPEGYSRGEYDYRRLCAREDLDLVVISTPWEWHTPMCVDAMKSGKHAAVEVPAAITLEECWQLVETAEKTGRQCIQMENCNYDRVELMAHVMVRRGLLGELVHAECGYLHDLRDSKLRLRDGKRSWRVEHSLRRNADLYPTHGLGPVAQTMNINRGNLFDHMVSLASKSVSLHQFALERYGPESPQAQWKFALGDVVSTLIRTRAGETILVTHDTNTPRPYSRRYLIQGTRGIIQKYPTPLVYLDGRSPQHEWEDLLERYAPEWEHPLWKRLAERARGAGHGGMDFIMNYRIVESLLGGEPLEMDVYDAAALSAVIELSERSIAGRGKTVDFPDFTRGKWKERAPVGIVAA
jgi:predicted dehydrogenase